VHDVWDVIGLKAPAPFCSVEPVHPEEFTALRDDPAALREQGPLYRLSTNMVFSMGFGATSLRVARDARYRNRLARQDAPGSKASRQQRGRADQAPERRCRPRAPIYAT
jgi:hypothetical protein